MPRDAEPTAAPFLPARRTLPALRRAAEGCRGCHLWRNATQTVFGAGKAGARVVLVGEQPGDSEDRQGVPFVGPAGKLLDEALAEAGIDRKLAYVTNLVKHFKWEPRGKRRIHSKPNASEIRACLPWLRAELDALAPAAVVCLGATAAQALLGKAFRVSTQRGRWLQCELAPRVLATVHPSSLLRAPDPETRRAEMRRFVADLSLVSAALSTAAA